MLSLGLVITWIYHFYDKSRYTNLKAELQKNDSLALARYVQDSLQQLYTHTISNLDARLDSSSTSTGLLKGELEKKLADIRKLRNEIATILRKSDINQEDLDMARTKTVELQQLVADLQNKNISIEDEKKQISAVLDKVNTQVRDLEGNVQKLDQENKVLTEKVSLASAFVASEIKLTPVTVKNEKELETTQAKKTTKLVVSFTVQNNISQYENADVYVVITQPDGRILKNEDVWETTTMNIQNGSRINFTRKIRFEYLKGERKEILFSLNAEDYQKGTYLMQLYHNGYLIGQSMKMLN